MIKYVCGFRFSYDMKQVALIKKTKPKWQAGKLNGIGGKVESDEYPADAMSREFEEETGLVTQRDEWIPFFTLKNLDYDVHFYKSFGDLSLLKTTTEEMILIINLDNLAHENTIPNLSWLLPLAKDLNMVNASGAVL